MATEEQLADDQAYRVLDAMRDLLQDTKKLELKTLRDLQRGCNRLAAECQFYIPVRLLQGGGKSQHARGKK